MPYPTKEQILEGNVTHKPEVVRLFKAWKRSAWKDARNVADEAGKITSKRIAITALVCDIANIYEKPVSVAWFPGQSNGHYDRESRTIQLVGEPSILTALHELAHHLFGLDELKVLRWSVWLFRKAFSRAYENLVWDGHMLVRPRGVVSDVESDRTVGDAG